MENDKQRPCAVVTGAGSGIGAASATRFARAGFDVVVNFSRNADGAEAVAESCRRLGVSAITAQGDVSRDADCVAIAKAGADAFGRIDVLVNNAGVTRYADASDLDALSMEDFLRIYGVNVAGTYQMIRAAAPHLQRSPAAAIVNVSSDSAISGDGSSLAYAASKGALNTMTLGLARSLAPQIRVNAVCPGFVDTSWALAWQSESSYEAFKKRVAAIAPLKTIPTADDVAETIFWLSTGANCITGQLIVIDSGTHLTVGSPMGPV
jgi:3-oxoacyl-[acyl-carrier protein] reductase